MATATIKVSVDIPTTYRVELLTQQLTDYAQLLVARPAQVTRKRRYRHEALRGIIAPERHDGELVEEYLREKYHV